MNVVIGGLNHDANLHLVLFRICCVRLCHGPPFPRRGKQHSDFCQSHVNSGFSASGYLQPFWDPKLCLPNSCTFRICTNRACLCKERTPGRIPLSHHQRWSRFRSSPRLHSLQPGRWVQRREWYRQRSVHNLECARFVGYRYTKRSRNTVRINSAYSSGT